MSRNDDAVLEELDAIRVFAAVAAHRSFRSAAKSLGLPRSTVSRRLVELDACRGPRTPRPR
ncbi:MAG: LysR family transcriptional regulator [Kofleriaceae bacterium]